MRSRLSRYKSKSCGLRKASGMKAERDQQSYEILRVWSGITSHHTQQLQNKYSLLSIDPGATVGSLLYLAEKLLFTTYKQISKSVCQARVIFQNLIFIGLTYAPAMPLLHSYPTVINMCTKYMDKGTRAASFITAPQWKQPIYGIFGP